MSQTVKILVIGPTQSGKSALSNFIAERQDAIGQNYIPTNGVRILEFEKEGPSNPRKPGQTSVLVELWDVSGDSKYSRCWPAIQKGAQGIILVFNPDNPKHQNEIESWVESFPKKIGIPANQCTCFAHHPSGRPIKGKTGPPKGAPTLNPSDTSIESGNDTIHPAFDKFFNQLMQQIYKKEEQLENNIME
ncbi:P-loop containing nucleoside triphosphate hydrolase [Pseudocohnilembus persalinus]|uniref:p-loop containing nucleoside triphosphate hydrolase n=1 Tax=Pseudocohnilembus persalinus TaxID=266149 RepID=A0A0V0QB24_PSEPJ|nr:P-loop containing nucleoside triphosphate hydrolase [Pseudocohnilembus persalinus]|eukprot:KRW99354.1 P-loop containing nucleoside triphosphate hydrolase [Pseudocohnilembus persalinus]